MAAGTLSPDDLRSAIEVQFQGFGSTDDAVDEGLTPFEWRLYQRWLPETGRILVVGCGSGRDLVALARRGYRVTGVDPQPDLIRSAAVNLERHGVQGEVFHGRIETAVLHDKFNAVIFAPACYSYIQGRAVRVASLVRLRAHLLPGCRLIVHHMTTESKRRMPVVLMRLASLMTGAGWRAEAGDSFTPYHNSNGNLYFAHLFKQGEVEAEGAEAGLRAVDEHRRDSRASCVVFESD